MGMSSCKWLMNDKMSVHTTRKTETKINGYVLNVRMNIQLSL